MKIDGSGLERFAEKLRREEVCSKWTTRRNNQYLEHADRF